MKLYRKFMSRFSEPYRIRNGWGLSPIRNKRELKALVKFCEDYLHKTLRRGNPGLSLEMFEIYTNTIKLGKGTVSTIQCHHCDRGDDNTLVYYNVYDYIKCHCEWY